MDNGVDRLVTVLWAPVVDCDCVEVEEAEPEIEDKGRPGSSPGNVSMGRLKPPLAHASYKSVMGKRQRITA
jgi:hypothetical protein